MQTNRRALSFAALATLGVCLTATCLWGGRPGHASDPALPHRADEPVATVDQALAGKDFPLTIKAGEISGDQWRQIDFHEKGSDAPATYLTTGRTFSQNGVVYLAAYPEAYDGWALDKQNRSVSRVDLKTPLKLSLLNLNVGISMSNIAPVKVDDLVAQNALVHTLTIQNRESASDSQLQQIGQGIRLYVEDYNGALPPRQNAKVLQVALYPYLKNDTLFRDSVTGKPFGFETTDRSSSAPTKAQAASIIVLYQSQPSETGTRGVLFLDGHASRVKEAEFARLLKNP